MSIGRRLGRRMRALFGRSGFDRELDEELAFHMEMEAAGLRRAGASPEQAAADAARRLGPVARIRDESRDARGVRRLEALLLDLRYAARSLRKRPAFTIAALVTLSLGIGATAAIVGAVHGTLLAPLPFARPDRLVFVWQNDRHHGDPRQEVSPANFLDWRERSRSFAVLAAAEPFGFDWRAPEGPESLSAWLVSEGFFDALAVPALLGRLFRADDHRANSPPVAVLGYALWQRRFGGDQNLVARTLTLDGTAREVVGILPREVRLPTNDAIFAPKLWAGWEATSRTSTFYQVVGRLRDGVTLEQARADLDAVSTQLAREYPQTNSQIGVTIVPIHEQITGRARQALLVLLGAVVLVFLVAIANVTSLQLARGTDRVREFALRRALGASGGRVARQVISESAVLGALGGVLGFALAAVALGAIRALAPNELPRVEALRPDLLVMVVATVLGVGSAVLAALAPALAAGRSDVAAHVHGGARTAGAPRAARRVRHALVTGQFATALVLLVGAFLFIRSFAAVLRQDRGFSAEGTAAVVLQTWGYLRNAAERTAFVREAESRLAALPGVRAVGMTSSVPLGETIGAEQGTASIHGRPVNPRETPAIQIAIVTEGFFEALRIPLRRGRMLGPFDDNRGAQVALVNEAFARTYLPGEDPLGKSVSVEMGRLAPTQPVEIVGVVGDVRRRALHESARPTVYLPFAQGTTGAIALIVNTRGDPNRIVDQVKRTVWSINATLPVDWATSFERLVGESVRERRFLLFLVGAFAATALALAATGIFGVISYTTTERTREIGVRLAFGADAGRVLRMVLAQGAALAGVGIVIGLGVAAVASRALRPMLFGVGPLDLAAFGASAGLLAAVALAACWLPARRAARLDPIEALRQE